MNIAELIRKASTYMKIDEDKLKKAYNFADRAHAGQVRKTGEPYITHPLGVAMILTEYRADEETLITALLHDVVEDTSYTLQDIEDNFGKKIAKLVDTLTKLPSSGAHGNEPHHQFDSKVESIRKIFEVMQDDVRVIVIKLCDRLHNMQSLDAFRPEKQKRIAQETLEILVKIADRLCIGDLKEKLELLCHRYLSPDAYKKHTEVLAKREEILASDKKRMLEKISRSKIMPHSRIVVREAQVFREQREETDILWSSMTEVTVLVKDEEACYLALRSIHSLWKSLSETIRDYIALPRSNGYQALETCVNRSDGSIVKFIIQTEGMLAYSKYGITLDCFALSVTGRSLHLPWMEHLKRIHMETKNRSADYLSALENDLLKGAITVYLSSDKIITLPTRATILDAAFYAYEEKAWKLKSISLNGVPTAYYHYIRQDDTIQCTFENSPQVEFGWLEWVETALGASYVKEYLKKSSRENTIHQGKKILEKFFIEEQRGFIEELSPESLRMIFKRTGVESLLQLYQKIGEGILSPYEVQQSSPIPTKGGLQHRMRLTASGTSNEVNSLLSTITKNLQQEYSAEIDRNRYDSKLTIITSPISPKQWKSIVLMTERQKKLTTTSISVYGQKTLEYLSWILLTLLWGLDPVIAYAMIQSGIEPINLTIVRFLTASVFLSSYILIRHVYVRRSYQVTPLIFFSTQNLFLGFFLFITAMMTYMSLESTRPSYYTVSMTIFGVLFVTQDLLRKKNLYWKTLSTVLLFTIGIVMLYGISDEFWSFKAKITTLAAVMSFSVYSYLSEYYQKRYKIMARYDQLFLMVSLFAALFSLGSLYFIDWAPLRFDQYAKTVGFSFLFTIIPYLVYNKLIKQKEKISLITYQLSGTILVAVVTEMIFLGLFPETQLVISVAIVYLSSLLFMRLSRENS